MAVTLVAQSHAYRSKQTVKHHLIDICDVTQRYTAAAFVKDACTAIESIRSRGKIALITGGTFLYLQAFVEGLSPVPVVSDMALCDYQTMFSHDIEKAYAFHNRLIRYQHLVLLLMIPLALSVQYKFIKHQKTDVFLEGAATS